MHLNKLVSSLAVVIFVSIALPLTVWATSSTADDKQTPAGEATSPNLLTNPGMDGQFVKQCSARNGASWVAVPCDPENFNPAEVALWATVQVPYGWTAWWRPPNNNFSDPHYFQTYPASCPEKKSAPLNCIAWHNPEYRDTAGGPQEYGPTRKVAGDNSQKYFTYYSTHEAGMYQVVGGVKPGDRLRFTVYMEGWSNGANDPSHSDFGQNMNLQVGIDPTGGNNPWSSNIIWTKPAESFDQFTQFAVEAEAKNNVVSVWTKSRPKYALQHNDVYVDEASLTVVKPTGLAPKPSSSKIYTTTRIITSTRVITSSSGITSTVVVTRSVVVTSTRPTATTKVTTTASSKVTTTTSSKVSAGTPVTATQSTTTSGNIPATYQVVRGDTLIAIARRFNIRPWIRLAEINNLLPPYKVEVGQILKLR